MTSKFDAAGLYAYVLQAGEKGRRTSEVTREYNVTREVATSRLRVLARWGFIKRVRGAHRLNGISWVNANDLLALKEKESGNHN